MTASALLFENVSYAYRSDMTLAKREALKSISFDVTSGEAFGFLGHNGAGKTTTIKCLLDLIRPSRGTIRLFGKSNQAVESRNELGYVPEQPYFYDYLTVGETLDFYARLAHVPAADRRVRIDAVLERLRISDRKNTRMRTLSKGLTQRVALAQALLHRPKILILDEPFSGLDPIGRKHFRDIILEEKRSGTTIFMATHILSDVERICDRASVLAHGELRQVFALKDLPSFTTPAYELVIRGQLPESKEHASEYETSDDLTRLRFASRDHAELALRSALSKRIEVETFETVRGDLEEVFVRLIGDKQAGII